MFDQLSTQEKLRANSLLSLWLQRPENKEVKPGTRRYYHFVGAAARYARHGPPPTRNQRLGYRAQKKMKARKAAIQLYGDPTKEFPKGTR